MGTVDSNYPDEEIYERIETNASNTFSISGENKREKERASKGQKGSEIKTNNWSSNGKTKSGEYVLSRSLKKPGGKEADKIDTATAVSWLTASTCENRDKTLTNKLEHWKVPNIV